MNLRKVEGPMGIFARLSDIITSNINALLDRAENPEWMIAQIIREMEEGLASAKRYAATAIAAERSWSLCAMPARQLDS